MRPLGEGAELKVFRGFSGRLRTLCITFVDLLKGPADRLRLPLIGSTI